MKSWMQQAREAAGLTTIECAKALLLSEKEYLIRENNPGMLTIDELVALSFELNDEPPHHRRGRSQRDSVGPSTFFDKTNHPFPRHAPQTHEFVHQIESKKASEQQIYRK